MRVYEVTVIDKEAGPEPIGYESYVEDATKYVKGK